MDDVIHCPVCNHSNPPDAEVCAFCGAPLKPGLTPAQPSEDEPDWLRDLRSADIPAQAETGAADAETLNASPETSDDAPDWLSRIRERNQEETGSSVELPGQESEDTAWLAGLRNETPSGQKSDDDWLSRLGAESPLSEDNTDTGAEGAAEPAAPADLPDWLRDFSQEKPDTTVPSGAGDNFAFDAQDEYHWLDNTATPGAEASEGPVQPSGEGDDLSSYLARLEGATEESAPAAGTPSQPSAEEGGVEWSIPEEHTEELLSSSEPDLSGVFATSGAETSPAYQPGEFSEDSFPDWRQYLQEGDASQPVEAKNAPGLPDATPEPDWLHDFTANDRPASPVSEEATIPDWLQEEPSAAAADISGEVSPASFDALKDAELAQPAAVEEPAVPDVPAGKSLEPPLAGVEGLAGWFDSLEQPASVPSEPTGAAGEPPAADQAASDTPEGEPTPDWLHELGEAPAETPGAGIPALIGGEEALASPAVEGDQPFAVDLPDWLNEEQAASETGEAAGAAETGGAELAHAELPDWVQEMRPIESIIPEQGAAPEADQRVEKAGPLAGMTGILPAEELAARYRKPPVYSMKLRVTEKQRSQAALFESILAEETQPLQLPRQRKQTRGTLLRVVLALILLVVLAIPLLPGMGISPLVMPALFPRDMQDMFNQIDKSLAPETPVLLAVDYEPGLSGEMSLAASALVAQLEARNTRIVVVSTIPAGPALASQLLTNAQQSNPKYDIAQRATDLGYLPGGATSLLAFARQPQMVAPSWQYTYLKDLPGLQGFGQIILLTDRAETGRAWVEQVQPAIGKVPLYIVASAQAAPLLEPYVGSGQVAGMVRGVLGGAMYAQLAGQSNNSAVGSLSAYQIGVGLAFILVLFGGLISGGAALLKRDRKDEE